MRIIYLLVVILIVSYLVTRQIEEVTPVEGEGSGVIYGKELEKARGVEQLLQERADKRMEQVDAMSK